VENEASGDFPKKMSGPEAGIPKVATQFNDNLLTTVQAQLDRHLRQRLVISFDGFKLHLRSAPARSVAGPFSSNLTSDLRTKLSELLREDMSSRYSEHGRTAADASLVSRRIYSLLGSWLMKFQGNWWGPWDLYFMAVYEFARKEISPQIFDACANEILDLSLAIARGGTA
jgi:hypothetical protein